MEIILTHQNADFDAIASMLGVYKLQPNAIPILPTRQHSTVQEFLLLYRNGLPFIDWDRFHKTEPVTQIYLTDTANRTDLRGVPANTPVLIYDHHVLDRKLQDHETWAGELIGAATTLLVERIRRQNIVLNTLEATLLALGIYADTGMFTYGGTTPRDVQAAAWLLEQGAVLDTIRRFISTPMNVEQQALFEVLLNHAQHRNIAGYNVTVSSATVDETINGINTVTSYLRDLLDSDALFTLVQMPSQTQLVARSTQDAINVGHIADQFGGGGHTHAAAAAFYNVDLDNLIERLWHCLEATIQPAVRIHDLMSYGVQTVNAETPIVDLIQQIRRIGHEGYPVLEDERVVGLLTLRDADRALEHGLKQSTVRDIMLAGEITLTPDDSIAQLEETMLASEWGQIPIIDDTKKLVGIVTRTDLIRHWGNTHPTQPPRQAKSSAADVRGVLGEDNLRLIEQLADAAQAHNISIYVVGGVVRDLLLQRPNFDIDFVVEGDGIAFAEGLCQQFGGRLHSHQPFGTAKWHLDEQVAAQLAVDWSQIPDHLDFATARSELYEHPTALPTVYNSGIKLDLRRRDFTINTIALQLSPKTQRWHLLDYYGGMTDLEKRVIRILHSLSFVDDPTRIIRAVRFSERLQFSIEPRTTDLITHALPMLRRITGERLRNELTLLLKEDEPERGLMKLQALGVLAAIHPQFQLLYDLRPLLGRLRTELPAWGTDTTLLKWHLALGHLSPDAITAICERLLFSKENIRSLRSVAQLMQDSALLKDDSARASTITEHLNSISKEALTALWLLTNDSTTRQHIERYVQEWRHVKPTINGNTLKQMGLPTGPHYRQILETVRKAWLDGLIQNTTEELALVHKLVREVDL